MSLPSSGSITPRSSRDHVVGGRQGRSTRRSELGRHDRRFYRVPPCNLERDDVTDRRRARRAERRLDVLKALGDNTRYAIYLELARSPLPLATAEIADTLDLHPNTVRPHLERMRDVGLLEVATRHPRRRRPAAAPLLARAPTRRRSASSRRRSRCSPACCCRWRPPPASTARPPPAPAGARVHVWRAGTRRPRSRASRPRGRAARRAGLRPRRRRSTTPARPWPSPTARSASWPRPTPSWCAPCTAAWSRASSTSSAAPRSVEFHALADRAPCQVRLTVVP